MKHSQSGNVLFYILVAVALLAALSYAVTQGNRSSTSGLSAEKTGLSAANIIEYSEAVANAVAQLRLRGCSDTEISFDNLVITTSYDNAFSPTDGSCNVFSLNGGGINFDSRFDLLYEGGYVLGDVGTGATDLMMQILTNQSTCIKINEMIGVNNSGSDGPPADKLSGSNKFQGDYTLSTSGGANATLDHVDLKGKMAACRLNTGSGSSAVYYYYKVLLAR